MHFAAQTPGRRSNSDPVPEPSEDPLPMSHSTSAPEMPVRSDATDGSSSMGAAFSASSSLLSNSGAAPGETSPADETAVSGDAAAEEATEGPAPGASEATGQPSRAAAEAPAGPPVSPDAAEGHTEGAASAARDVPSGSAGQTGAVEGPSAASVSVQNGREAASGHQVMAPDATGGSSVLNVSAAAAEGLTGAEGEHSPIWQQQPKHVFVLTSAGAGFARSGQGSRPGLRPVPREGHVGSCLLLDGCICEWLDVRLLQTCQCRYVCPSFSAAVLLVTASP